MEFIRRPYHWRCSLGGLSGILRKWRNIRISCAGTRLNKLFRENVLTVPRHSKASQKS